jgi:hypothetical protein
VKPGFKYQQRAGAESEPACSDRGVVHGDFVGGVESAKFSGEFKEI